MCSGEQGGVSLLDVCLEAGLGGLVSTHAFLGVVGGFPAGSLPLSLAPEHSWEAEVPLCNLTGNLSPPSSWAALPEDPADSRKSVRPPPEPGPGLVPTILSLAVNTGQSTSLLSHKTFRVSHRLQDGGLDTSACYNWFLLIQLHLRPRLPVCSINPMPLTAIASTLNSLLFSCLICLPSAP